MSCVLRFGVSRSPRRPLVRLVSPTVRPAQCNQLHTLRSSVLALWINQGTHWFCCEPLQTPQTWCDLHTNPTHDLVSTVTLARTWFRGSTKESYTTSSCSSCHRAVRTWSCQPLGPSNQAYLSLHNGGHTGIDLSCLLFTYINANQATTCTYNTKPRVSPHNVVNHSSLRSDHPPILGRTQVLIYWLLTEKTRLTSPRRFSLQTNQRTQWKCKHSIWNCKCVWRKDKCKVQSLGSKRLIDTAKEIMNKSSDSLQKDLST
jgi:hypothetical protein